MNEKHPETSLPRGVFGTCEEQDKGQQLLVNWINIEDIRDREELIQQCTKQKSELVFEKIFICSLKDSILLR